MNGRDDFAGLPWHDASISRIEIDRRDPGRRDEVVVDVTWPDGTASRIRFQECWRIEALMNFGVVAPETVLTAWEVSDNAGLQLIRDSWGHLGAHVHALRCFVIETNSTGGTITVYAGQWGEEPIGGENA